MALDRGAVATASLTSLACAALLAGTVLAAPAQDTRDAPLERRSVRELYLGQPAGTRVEFFRLDREPAEPGARKGAPLGIARWIGGPDPEGEGGWRVECDTLFFDSETHVIHTERLRPRARKLVWREVRERSGRTVFLTWDPELGVKSIEMTGNDQIRRELDPGRGALLPLSAVEMVRQGTDLHGSAPVFQPLGNALETLSFSVRDQADERVLELRREDELCAGSYRFRGKELVAFRWQAGGPMASRITRAQYEALLATRKRQLATPSAAEGSGAGSEG